MIRCLLRDRSKLVGIFLLGFGLRCCAVFIVGSYLLDHVTYEHGEIAANLVQGRGFSVMWMGSEGPTSTQAPVYPTMVAVSYWLLGVGSANALFAMQLTQAVIGAMLPLMLFGLVNNLIGRRAGIAWFAAIGGAAYPTLVYTTTQIQVVSVAPTLVIATLWLATLRPFRGRWTVAFGLFSGVLVLTDPILGLVPGVGVLSMAVAGRFTTSPRQFSWSTRLGHSLVAAGLMVLTLTPWMIRNRMVHGEWVFVKSTFGYAFWQGNHPRSWGTDKIPLETVSPALGGATIGFHDLEKSLWKARLIDTLYIDDAVLPNERIAYLGTFPEPQRSRKLFREVSGYIAANPGRYVRLCLQRLFFFHWFDPTNPKARVLPYRLAHGTLTLLSLLGCLMSLRDFRVVWPTHFCFILVSCFHAATISSARFHIPLEPFQLIWSAYVAGWAFSFAKQRSPFARLIPRARQTTLKPGVQHG